MTTQNPESETWRLTTDLLGVLDADGVFRDTNPAWFETLGLSPEDIESQLFFEFLHPEDLAKTAKAFVDVQQGRAVLQFENRYRHKDGSYRWLSWNAVPEGDLYYCAARDVTVAKEAENALRRHEEEAKLREQFISILGHDLRNPLAGATCAVEYIRDRETLSGNGHIVLESADNSLRRMSQLIDDVLDFARSRMGGAIGVDAIPGVRLEPVLRQTVTELALAHPDAIFDQVYEFTEPVTCDPARLAQLVSNLLGNAVYHGQTGGRIRVHAQDAGGNIAVSVTNQGGTIPAGVMKLLFQPFKRVEPGSSQNGLGLGLYISKQIADGHDGDIDVVSEGGETTFTLRIPRGPRMVNPIDGDELQVA